MRVINHIHCQNVISNKVNSIHMAANSQTYLTVTGIRQNLIRAENTHNPIYDPTKPVNKLSYYNIVEWLLSKLLSL